MVSIDMRGFFHAGRKLDVEMFDGEFAGDEARGEQVTSFAQICIDQFKMPCHDN